jgi:hypothetical protein
MIQKEVEECGTSTKEGKLRNNELFICMMGLLFGEDWG